MISFRQSLILLTLITFVGGLTACHAEKKGTEQSVFNQRKPFKVLFHEANSEKMIGHTEQAILLFEECLMLEPTNSTAHFALSELYAKLENKEKSLRHAEQAYTYAQDNKWYTLHLADLYYEREEYEKTADLYASIIGEEKNIDLKFKYVDVLMRTERSAAAIDMLNEIEIETGKLPELSFTKYELYSKLGKTELAFDEITSFIRESTSQIEAKIMVAEYYLDRGKVVESQAMIAEVIKVDPSNGQAYILLADIDIRKGNLTGAFNNLEKGFKSNAVDLDRKLEIIRGLIPYAEKNQIDHKTIRDGLTRLFKLIYDPTVENATLHEYYGLFLLAEEKLEQSALELQLACDINPSSFNTWLQLLSIQNQQKDFEALAQNGAKAAELFPSQPILYLFAGIGDKEMNHYLEAEEWFFIGKELVVRDPQLSSEFLFQIGDLNYRQGNTEEGFFYFEQAITLNPANVNVYESKVLHLMNSNRLSEAEFEIKSGLEQAPRSSKLLDLYGQILFLKKDFAGAAEAFQKALYEDFENGELLERCGDALFLMGNKESGIEFWGEAIKRGNTSATLQRKFDEKAYYKAE